MRARGKNTSKRTLQVILALEAIVLAVLVIFLFFASKPRNLNNIQTTTLATTPQPSGTTFDDTTTPSTGKKPEDYTWDDFCALSLDEQAMFSERFENAEAFRAWLLKVQPQNTVEIIVPEIILNGKKPEDVTWEEYQSLTATQQAMFPDYFESLDAFNNWFANNQPQGTQGAENQELNLNGKKPHEFTWEEYQSLSEKEKELFSTCFGSLEEFRKWQDSVQPPNTESSGIDLNGRNPEDFTWEEYQALTAIQKAVFPDCFESLDAFDRWYIVAQQQSVQEPEATGINLNGRNPEDFSWEEYQALTAAQQAMFPDCFESLDAFNRWYIIAQQQSVQEPEISGIDLNGRDPEDFTWEEYRALTSTQQAIFPDLFKSYDEFLYWQERVRPKSD